MELEKVLLVGVNLNDGEDFEQSMKELASLAEACYMEPVGSMIQNLSQINQGLYIGTGKVEEVKREAEALGADIIIFDNTLSPTQLRNLQKELEHTILDRTALILEIFSERAQTREAKMQVETAKLQYMLPRLVGLRASLGRQGGGSGSSPSNKGSGEKKLELDRRHIEHRLNELKKELEEVGKERETQRKQRMQSGIQRVALVGYTNAGKSTLLNALLDEYVKDDTKKVLEKDMLFATLDTTVRKITPKGHKPFLLSDTVGFIHKLPHNLVKAFRSTLEEAKYADLLLEVVDYADEHYKEHMRVTEETLKEIGAEDIPVLVVYNKADLAMEALPRVEENAIYLSAKKRIGLEELLQTMEQVLIKDYISCKMLIPYAQGSILSYFNTNADIIETEYLEEGTGLIMNCRKADYQKYEEYAVKE